MIIYTVLFSFYRVGGGRRWNHAGPRKPSRHKGLCTGVCLAPPAYQVYIYVRLLDFFQFCKGVIHIHARRPRMLISDLLEWLTGELEAEMLEALEMDVSPLDTD